MKVVFVHIPKTAGSTVSSIMSHPSVAGKWLLERDLWNEDPEELWACDMLAGHFTRNHLRRYVRTHGLSMEGVRLVTMVREPILQLYSNLNFPFELASRALPDQWMHDAAIRRTLSPLEIIDILEAHPWLLNIQTKYLMLDEERLDPNNYDFVGIFPHVGDMVAYLCTILGVEAPVVIGHENRAARHLRLRDFYEPPLSDYLREAHALDIGLYAAIRDIF